MPCRVIILPCNRDCAVEKSRVGFSLNDIRMVARFFMSDIHISSTSMEPLPDGALGTFYVARDVRREHAN